MIAEHKINEHNQSQESLSDVSFSDIGLKHRIAERSPSDFRFSERREMAEPLCRAFEAHSQSDKSLKDKVIELSLDAYPRIANNIPGSLALIVSLDKSKYSMLQRMGFTEFVDDKWPKTLLGVPVVYRLADKPKSMKEQ